MHFNISSIEHKNQRYSTVGDWKIYYDDQYIIINVSEMNNPDYEFLVGIHELIEAYLCFKRGIKEEVVTNFDVEFEKHRSINDFSEPGDSENAPYHKEHQFATEIEKLISNELGVDWEQYNKTVNEL